MIFAHFDELDHLTFRLPAGRIHIDDIAKIISLQRRFAHPVDYRLLVALPVHFDVVGSIAVDTLWHNPIIRRCSTWDISKLDALVRENDNQALKRDIALINNAQFLQWRDAGQAFSRCGWDGRN